MTLEEKKRAIMNRVASGGTTEIRVATHSTGNYDASLDITVNGVTNNYLFTSLRLSLKIVDSVVIYYDNTNNVYSYVLVFLSKTFVNGNEYNAGDTLAWKYNETIDYNIVTNNISTNKVSVKTVSTNGNNASVLIVDNESSIIKVFNASQTYSKSVDIYYQNGWKVIANQNVEYNGVVFTNGQTVDSWAYNTNKFMQIKIL